MFRKVKVTVIVRRVRGKATTVDSIWCKFPELRSEPFGPHLAYIHEKPKKFYNAVPRNSDLGKQLRAAIDELEKLFDSP